MIGTAIISAFVGGVSGALVAQVTNSLDKSKIVFEKKLIALSALRAMQSGIFEIRPEQLIIEWEEISTDLYHDSDDIVKKLKTFQEEHSAVLNEQENKYLSNAIQKMVNCTFLNFADVGPYGPDNEQKKSLEIACDNFFSLEKHISDDIEKQIGFWPAFYSKKLYEFLKSKPPLKHILAWLEKKCKKQELEDN